jgi:hypothetical protein
MMVTRPERATDAIGMLASAVLFVEGIFEILPFIVLGFQRRFQRTLLGVYCLGMGTMIWVSSSSVALWLVSLGLSVDVLMNASLICYVSVKGHLPEDGGWNAAVGKASTSRVDAPELRVAAGTKRRDVEKLSA